MYGKPSAHQASFKVEEPPSQLLPPTSNVVYILKEDYNQLMSLHSNFDGSGSTATLAQQGTSNACLATQDPWVIDSGATDHMTGLLSLSSEGVRHHMTFYRVVLYIGYIGLLSF